MTPNQRGAQTRLARWRVEGAPRYRPRTKPTVRRTQAQIAADNRSDRRQDALDLFDLFLVRQLERVEAIQPFITRTPMLERDLELTESRK